MKAGQGFFVKFPSFAGSKYERQYDLLADTGRHAATGQEAEPAETVHAVQGSPGASRALTTVAVGGASVKETPSGWITSAAIAHRCTRSSG